MRHEKDSSQKRIRTAGKTLFAEKGYEATTIADITKAAKTSHSQFLKYYTGKEELRKEIVEQQWLQLTKSILLAIPGVSSPKGKLTLALNMLISFLEADPEFRTILLLEQTATHDSDGIAINREFREFAAVIEEIVNAMKAEGELLPHVNVQALRSALVASVEGMMRDQLMTASGFPADYSVQQVREMVSIFTASACDSQTPTMEADSALLAAEIVRSRSPEDEWIRYYLKLGDTVLHPSDLS